MTQVGLIIFLILSYELLTYLKLINLFKFNLIILKKLLKTFSNKTFSDKKKEFLILGYSKKLLFSSLKIIFNIILILILFYFFNLFFSNLLKFSTSIYGILFSIICLFIYTKLKRIYE